MGNVARSCLLNDRFQITKNIEYKVLIKVYEFYLELTLFVLAN